MAVTRSGVSVDSSAGVAVARKTTGRSADPALAMARYPSARGFVLESKGAWAKAATAARVVRLAKLPFVLGTLGLFALNAAVIVGGLIALVILLA